MIINENNIEYSNCIIYLIVNTINKKTYVGKFLKDEKYFKYYWGSGILIKKAIKKYGKTNFIKEKLITGHFNKNLINDLEKHYIQLYSPVLSKNSYNLASGGEGGGSVRLNHRKPVYQFTTSGKLLNIWSSVQAIYDSLKINKSAIYANLTHNNITCKGYIFSYNRDISKLLLKVSKHLTIQHKFRILQYLQDGTEIKYWNSQHEAEKELSINRGGIAKAIYNNNTCNGFLWKKVL